MEKRITDLVFILDISGSMRPLSAATIKSFNEMLRSQKEESCEDEAYVTTVTFNHTTHTLSQRKPIGEAREMTAEDYMPQGYTALNDAIGETINSVENLQREDLEAGRTIHTLFVIITDGLENASRTYTRAHVRDLIKTKKELGWNFLFLGSEFDVKKEGRSFGFRPQESIHFSHDDDGISRIMQDVGYCCCSMRTSAPNDRITDTEHAEETTFDTLFQDVLNTDGKKGV